MRVTGRTVLAQEAAGYLQISQTISRYHMICSISWAWHMYAMNVPSLVADLPPFISSV